MYKRHVIRLENKGTAILETTGKISITLQNLEEGKYTLYLDNTFIENIHSQNSKINTKIRTNHDINVFYKVIIKKEENIFLEGIIKEKPAEVASKPIAEKTKITKTPIEPIIEKAKNLDIPTKPIIKENKIINEPIIEESKNLDIPTKPIIEEPKIDKIALETIEPIIEEAKTIKTPIEPIIEKAKNLDIPTANQLDLFKTKPVIMPFKNQKKPYNWVRLNIHDLIHLPIEIWPFSRDQYILACYRKYKHFIFGEHKSDYILGVPDIYRKKNKLMLNKRGFLQFKSCENNEIEDGTPGYWLMPVIIL